MPNPPSTIIRETNLTHDPPTCFSSAPHQIYTETYSSVLSKPTTAARLQNSSLRTSTTTPENLTSKQGSHLDFPSQASSRSSALTPQGAASVDNNNNGSNIMAACSRTTQNVNNSESTSTYRPSRKNAVVLENVQQVSQDQCLRAVADIIQGKNIHYCNRLSGGRLCLYLTDETCVNTLCNRGGVDVGNQNLPCRRYVSEATRLIISNCPPEMPDDALRKLLEPYGKIVSTPTRQSVTTNHDDLKHVMTWKRSLYMNIPTDAPPCPEVLQLTNAEGAKHTIYIEIIQCKFCQSPTHTIGQCEKKEKQNKDYPALAYTPSPSVRLSVPKVRRQSKPTASPDNPSLEETLTSKTTSPPPAAAVSDAADASTTVVHTTSTTDAAAHASTLSSTSPLTDVVEFRSQPNSEENPMPEDSPDHVTSNIANPAAPPAVAVSAVSDISCPHASPFVFTPPPPPLPISVPPESRPADHSKKRLHSPQSPNPSSSKVSKVQKSTSDLDSPLQSSDNKQQQIENFSHDLNKVLHAIPFNKDKLSKKQFKNLLYSQTLETFTKTVLERDVDKLELLTKLNKAKLLTSNDFLLNRIKAGIETISSMPNS